MSSAETVVSRLQGLTVENDICQVEVYRYSDSKFYNRSDTWSFGHEYIQVGNDSYNLGRMVTFLVVDQCLCLYF
jgi:hypothetical protein